MKLTKRELEILRSLAVGGDYKRHAAALKTSEANICAHAWNIRKKLSLGKRCYPSAYKRALASYVEPTTAPGISPKQIQTLIAYSEGIPAKEIAQGRTYKRKGKVLPVKETSVALSILRSVKILGLLNYEGIPRQDAVRKWLEDNGHVEKTVTIDYSKREEEEEDVFQ